MSHLEQWAGHTARSREYYSALNSAYSAYTTDDLSATSSTASAPWNAAICAGPTPSTILRTTR